MAPTVLRALVPVAVATTMLAVPQAAAASPITDLDCGAAGTRYRCDLILTVDPASALVRWYIDGIRRTPFDQSTTVAGLCLDGQRITIQVSVTDRSGDVDPTKDPFDSYRPHTDTRTALVQCQENRSMA
jgi:hypothetical protein